MPEIKLFKRKVRVARVAIVSQEDYEYLRQYHWHFDGHYARRAPHIRMHRVIMERMLDGPIPKGYEVDHIDRNRLNNQRENLRLATRSQNNMNQVRSGERGGKFTSKYRGVSWKQHARKWMARVTEIYLGYFDTEEDAARAYDAKVTEMFGKFTELNFPEE